MSNSKVQIKLESEDNSTELLLVDSNLSLVKRGFGRLDAELSPGIYKVKSKVGSAMQEEVFEVSEDAPRTIKLPPVVFDSPIPLENTTQTHEYHQLATIRAIKNIKDRPALGTGASILLVIRDPRGANKPAETITSDTYTQSFNGFCLYSKDGEKLVDYGKELNVELEQGIATLHIEVEPGNYLLVYLTGEQPAVCIPLTAVVGWSTQHYILLELSEDKGNPARADISGSARVMMHMGCTADSFKTLRLAEVARHALERGKNMLDEESMKVLLQRKLENPFSGVLAAHLIMLDEKPDMILIDTVINNIAALVGEGFPDVVALRYIVSQRLNACVKQQHCLDFPPVCRRSWDGVMAMCMDSDATQPLSPVMLNAFQRLTSKGIWTAWNTSEQELSTMQIVNSAPLSNNIFSGIKQYLEGANITNYLATIGDVITHKTTARTALRDIESIVGKGGQYDKKTLIDAASIFVTKLPWDNLINWMEEIDSDGSLSNKLNRVQKSLLLNAIQLRQSQKKVETLYKQEDISEYIEQSLRSLNVPSQVMLDNLTDLVKICANIAIKKQP